MGKNYWAINKSYVEGGNNGLREQEKLRDTKISFEETF